MALLLLLSLLFLPQDKPPEKCSLSGTVLDSVTGEPLNKVALRLEPIGREATAATTISDAKGHFALVDLDSGAYRLRGTRGGYLEMVYGARRPGNGGTIVRLDAGQTPSDLNFKLTPAGAIAGTIRDSDGEPIEDAGVYLGRIVYSNRGRPRLERTRSAYSDDRGEYRFHGLPPGKYYISVAANQSRWALGEVDRSASTGPTEASVTTFYPGAPDSSTAFPVEVSAGARVAGIDVTLLRRRVVCVSGRVAMPSRAGRLVIELEGANAAMGNYSASTSAKNTAGDFQFCRVPSGSYVLSAYSESLSARVPVNVGPGDVNDIRLTLSPGAEIHGRVLADGQAKPNLRDVRFQIGVDGRNEVSGSVSEDGAFTIRNWRQDHYDVGIPAAPRGFYVKSIRSGEADVLTNGLTVSGSGTVPLEVVLSPDGGELSGLVLDTNQQPAAGATVLLAPEQRSRLDLFKSTTTDQRGYYQFTALAPGAYKLFAWDDVEPNEWNAPDFFKDYEKQGEKAFLEPKAHVTANLHLAVRPDEK
jgi:5-hydroxyisourate hydrolase-like protein (transthyretin family)